MFYREIIVRMLAVLACGACGNGDDDPRCADPRVGSISLAALAGNDVYADVAKANAPPDRTGVVPVGGLCDGSRGIKLAFMQSNGPGAFADYEYLEQYGGRFFLLDGYCHFFALDGRRQQLMEGELSAELLAQLTAELALDALADMPSSADLRSPHYHDALLATSTHSLRCRDDRCRTPEATALLERGVHWIDKLAAFGRPTTSLLTAFAFPKRDASPEDLGEGYVHPPELAWPLEWTMRSLAFLIEWYRADLSPRVDAGLELVGANAEALRALRSEAHEVLSANGSGLPAIDVSDCGQSYRLLLRDELPSWIEFDFVQFLQAAWARPVIESCRDVDGTEHTPCPPEWVTAP